MKAQETSADAPLAPLSQMRQTATRMLAGPLRGIQRPARKLLHSLEVLRRSFRHGRPQFQPRRDTFRRKVSVVVLSYNHQAYIAECLDSILMQRGFYAWEVILGDDCSTDATPEILRTYQDAHPELMRSVARPQNLGFPRNLIKCLEACTGDYVAVCEGDDYWTDPFKLQKQLEFLEDHPDCPLCFNALTVDRGDRAQPEPLALQQSLKKDLISTEDLIWRNYIANLSACMYRTAALRQVLHEILEFDAFPPAEWIINMACGRLGSLGFLRERMSVYRIHEKGAWSGLSEVDQWIVLRSALPVYYEFLGHQYEAAFVRLLAFVDSEITRLYLAAQSTAASSATLSPGEVDAVGEARSGDLAPPTNLAEGPPGFQAPSQEAATTQTEIAAFRARIVRAYRVVSRRLGWLTRFGSSVSQKRRNRHDVLDGDRESARQQFQPRRDTMHRKVSVVVLSYNEEDYIAQCMDGILMQEGSFAWEIVVGDDASTDRTPAILAEYQARHPQLVKLMPPAANLGAPKNLWRCLEASTGEYVAICEGDDYWTDRFKLQKQIQFLEDHPECPLCFSAVSLRYPGSEQLLPHSGQKLLLKRFLSTEDLIGHNYAANASSCVYRTDVLRQTMKAIFEFGRFPVGEWIVNMACARAGKIGFLPEAMSVYRINQQGTWSSQGDVEQWRGIRQRLEAYNAFLGPEYNDDFAKTRRLLDALIAVHSPSRGE